MMKYDPFTLRVALDKKGFATGELYMDDGDTFGHQDGKLVWRAFNAEKQGKVLRIANTDLAAKHPSTAVDGVALAKIDPENEYAKSVDHVRVEKLVVVGLNGKPASVSVEGGKELQWTFTPGVASSDKKEGVASVLTVKDPGVGIAKEWAIIVRL